jgi:hypothetical protein
MKFIVINKTNAHYEAGGKPPADLARGVGAMIGELVRAGKLLAADGLRPSSLGVRLRFASGKRTITQGPFAGDNELVAGFAAMKVRSLDEAIAWATKFAGAWGEDLEIDVRPATEAWDIGLGEEPKEITTRRYYAMHKATPKSEVGTPPTDAQVRAVNALLAEMTGAGVLLSTAGLKPSHSGARVRNFGGKKVVLDGPFAESKELVGGFVILDLGSRAEAIDWAKRYADALGEIELDVLEVQG